MFSSNVADTSGETAEAFAVLSEVAFHKTHAPVRHSAHSGSSLRVVILKLKCGRFNSIDSVVGLVRSKRTPFYFRPRHLRIRRTIVGKSTLVKVLSCPTRARF